MKRVEFLALAFGIVLVLGCGGKRSKEEIERGNTAVAAALESWKANDSARLRTLPEPVEFTDDIRGQYELVEYSIGAVDASEMPFIRYTVRLRLKDKRGQLSDREVVYSVQLANPVRVIRDPYF